MLKEEFKAKRSVSIWKKINPLWWFGNEDDGWYGDDKWRAGRNKTLALAVEWFFRNFMHNLTFYVLGIADHDRTFYSTKVWGERNPDGSGTGFSFHSVIAKNGFLPLPMVAYVGEKRGWYIGWRPYGSFGISLNFAKKD